MSIADSLKAQGGYFFHLVSLWNAVFYGVLFFMAAGALAFFFRSAVERILKKDSARRIDRTYAIFLTKFGVLSIYGFFFVLYTQLIPSLHSIAAFLLTGASIISLTVGLAAQNTLGNMVAGLAILIYRPFHVGDTIRVSVPGGADQGVVEQISLGYTTLSTEDQRRILVPNGVMLGQTIIKINS